MSPLALLRDGETAEIVGEPIRCGHGQRHGRHCGRSEAMDDHVAHRCIGGQGHDRLVEMGIRLGKRIRMIANSGTGPIVLQVDESRIAMGRGAAMKIYVRRIEP